MLNDLNLEFYQFILGNILNIMKCFVELALLMILQLIYKNLKKALPLLEKLGVKVNNPEAEFKNLDDNKSGSIMFDEFCEFAIKKYLDLEDDEDFDDCELKNFKK